MVDPAFTSLTNSASDEELMRDLARGRQDALGPLYSRYAPLVFNLGVQSLDRTAAEELVQEVFLTIWRGAANFDASQGPFRPWLLRLTHWKILNELRTRRRRPAVDADAELDETVDRTPGPEERAWQHDNESIVKSALAALPPKQRQAIALAFLEDMTHEQVARTLDVPLGTAKTRIRSGLQLMRGNLAPLAASLLGLAVAVLGVRTVQTQFELQRDTRAILLVTTSDVTPLRLTPVTSAVPAGAHANYRGRDGNSMAVLTTELLPEPAAGEGYTAWVRHGTTWTALGSLTLNGDGTSVPLIADNPVLTTPPDQVEITLETAREASAQTAPSGEAVLSWSAP